MTDNQSYRTMEVEIDYIAAMSDSIAEQILNSNNDEIIENYHRILAIAMLKVDEALRAVR